MKKQVQIEVELIFTDGWQERFTKACYNLYLKAEKKLAITAEEFEQEAC